MKRQLRLLMSLVSVLCVLSARQSMAQSTILKVPTTDTIAKGEAYLEFDWLAQTPNPQGRGRLLVVRPRVVLGVGRNVEIGANVPVFHRAGTTDVFLEPNVKWRFASSDSKGLAASTGSVLVTPLNNRIFLSSYALGYINFSQKIAGTYGPRFTAGSYGVLTRHWSGPNAGAILGYEQPLHSKVSIVADWLSGQNAIGYLTAGLSFKVSRNGLVNLAYSFGNDSHEENRANRFLHLRYGVRF